MFTWVLLASLIGSPVEPEPKSAQFEITVEANTPYSLFLNGKPIDANTLYKTEPISKLVCVEIEIRYVCGEEVAKKTFYMNIEPGYRRCITIKLSAKPTYAMC